MLGVIVLILFPILFLFRVRNGKKGAAFVISLLITALLVIGGRLMLEIGMGSRYPFMGETGMGMGFGAGVEYKVQLV